MTELPESKGAYVLIASVAQTKRLAIGRLGEFIIIPGFYAYVGSACGHGSIRARVSHHLESIAQPHWHIDSLLGFATPIEVWYAISDCKLERDWAKMLQDSPKFRIPIPRFGSSDYHRTRTTHLFYSKRRPLFRWFEEKIREVFEPSIRAQQFILPASASTSCQPFPGG
jgi:Uri superfamily endonuclease